MCCCCCEKEKGGEVVIGVGLTSDPRKASTRLHQNRPKKGSTKRATKATHLHDANASQGCYLCGRGHLGHLVPMPQRKVFTRPPAVHAPIRCQCQCLHATAHHAHHVTQGRVQQGARGGTPRSSQVRGSVAGLGGLHAQAPITHPTPHVQTTPNLSPSGKTSPRYTAAHTREGCRGRGLM